MTERPIRWGIVSTANIARSSFLPALRAAGGEAYAVGGRDPERTRQYAADNGVEHALDSYDEVCRHPEIDAVYVPTPNALHAGPTVTALRAGKAVLAEKPLCATVADTEAVLRVARETGSPLWEAFVFPFHEQTRKVVELLDNGAVGELAVIESTFHFKIKSRDNVRLSVDLGGGAMQDVGCYNIRLARLLFNTEPEYAAGNPVWAPEGVDEEMQGILRFPGDSALVFSCSMRLAPTTFTRLLCTEGEIRLTHPFHAGPEDTIEVRRGNEVKTIHAGNMEPSFTPALRHIHAVLRGEEAPRHLAVDEALGNAAAIEMVYASAGAREVTA